MVRTDGWAVYGHVITKFSGMGRFTYPWCSAGALRVPELRYYQYIMSTTYFTHSFQCPFFGRCWFSPFIITFNSARSRLSSVGKKGKKGKRKKSGKKKEPPPPPPVGPWIQKLHLLDNGIDAHGVGSTLGPVMCMKMFRKLVAHLHMPSIFSKKITNVFLHRN